MMKNKSLERLEVELKKERKYCSYLQDTPNISNSKFQTKSMSEQAIKTLEKNIKFKKLSIKIDTFLNKHAGISPNWDKKSKEGKYTSPDAYQMEYCAEQLDVGEKPIRCFSEWGSGGYKPYSSKEGREEHDNLVKEIYEIINNG